ncbi:hypothetical protein CL649_03420 [bacterium]|nr:hypothetical protein [bacterium]|tara:strand:- start:7382 stop:7795 length:414 start_codon:yes stop_codon:yes gene_type:complete
MPDEIIPEEGDSSEHKESSIEVMPESKIGKHEITNLPVTATPMSGPSKPSQAMAFGSILLGGLCGGLIGFAFTDLQCSNSCTGASGISALIGAIVGAGGVGVVSILALRAMNEWRSKSEPEPSANSDKDDQQDPIDD